MIPAKYGNIAFGFLLSFMMSSVISGISTFRAVGLDDNFFGLWLGAWLTSWAVAFPIVLVVAPFVRKVVGKLVRVG